MPKLHIVIASTRPTRKGPSIAKWFQQFTMTHGKFDVELIDLADFNLPVYDEPEHPMKQNYQHDHTKKWSASVAVADAFVFVQPEYNHFMPVPLLNAMTYVYKEWNYKPLGFVSYGYTSAATRSVEPTKLLATTLKLTPLAEGVAIPFFDKKIDETGVFLSDEFIDNSAKLMLDELLRYTNALKVLRT